MEADPSMIRAFNSLIIEGGLDVHGVEQRVCQLSEDMRLVIAVHDLLSARIMLFFPFDGETTDSYQKQYDDASKALAELSLALQHEYGLNEQNVGRAIELTRCAIEESGLSLD